MNFRSSDYTLLKKIAVDNGFGEYEAFKDGWLIHCSFVSSTRVCLSKLTDKFAIGTNYHYIIQNLDQIVDENFECYSFAPVGFAVCLVEDLSTLNKIALHMHKLSNSLSHLKEFEEQLIQNLPTETEVENLRRERIGQ